MINNKDKQRSEKATGTEHIKKNVTPNDEGPYSFERRRKNVIMLYAALYFCHYLEMCMQLRMMAAQKKLEKFERAAKKEGIDISHIDKAELKALHKILNEELNILQTQALQLQHQLQQIEMQKESIFVEITKLAQKFTGLIVTAVINQTPADIDALVEKFEPIKVGDKVYNKHSEEVQEVANLIKENSALGKIDSKQLEANLFRSMDQARILKIVGGSYQQANGSYNEKDLVQSTKHWSSLNASLNLVMSQLKSPKDDKLLQPKQSIIAENLLKDSQGMKQVNTHQKELGKLDNAWIKLNDATTALKGQLQQLTAKIDSLGGKVESFEANLAKKSSQEQAYKTKGPSSMSR